MSQHVQLSPEDRAPSEAAGLYEIIVVCETDTEHFCVEHPHPGMPAPETVALLRDEALRYWEELFGGEPEGVQVHLNFLGNQGAEEDEEEMT